MPHTKKLLPNNENNSGVTAITISKNITEKPVKIEIFIKSSLLILIS